MNDIFLWIDDERSNPPGFTHWVKTSQEAIDVLKSLKDDDFLAIVSFDHDLSYDQTDGHPKAEPENIEYDDSRRVATWMIENNVFPQVVVIHTQNPVGAKWLYDTFTNDGPEGLPVARAPYSPRNYAVTGNTEFKMTGKYH